MRSVFALLFLTAFSAGPMAAQINRPDDRVPLKECVHIQISTPTHWNLDIEPDGSGLLREALSAEEAHFPEKTFSFAEVYHALAILPAAADGYILKRGKGYPIKCEAVFRTTKSAGYAKSIDDDILITSLFQKARSSAGEGFTPRLIEIWDTQAPIIPKTATPRAETLGPKPDQSSAAHSANP